VNEVQVLEIVKKKESPEVIDGDAKQAEVVKVETPEEKMLREKEELTPEGSYDEDDISIYYDYTDENNGKEMPTFFASLGALCQQRVN
jgi:hypothetical protein